MPVSNLQLRVAPETAYQPEQLKVAASTALGIDVNRIKATEIRRRSIDARQRRVMVNLSVDVHVDEKSPFYEPELPSYPALPPGAPQAIIVGAGPAGLFAALELLENGIRPILLERGKDVDSRRRDMARIAREGVVDPESNYCFGEGGAGAFSDGKLYTRSKKRGSVDKVLAILWKHGASRDILVDAHPHIGTDRLPEVIKSIRNFIITQGGEVHFGTCVSDLILSSDGKEVTGVITRDGKHWNGPVILATGHSARDVYRALDSRGIEIEPKGIAVGVRLEHPQQLIDSIQYHNPRGRGKYLPAAEYSMLTRVDGRAVYSFCMCPGGFIIPAASEPGQLVVNGMSPSSRGTKWANSGMVVEVLPEDLDDQYDASDRLKVMKFQEDIERRFFEEGDGSQNAPAQRMTDFVASRASKSLPSTSYAPGIHPARIDRLLPAPIARRLQKGLEEFGRKSRGFLSPEATLIGAETRTSSPVRIPRDPAKLHHVGLKGLYPSGEGAGYAGGIVSAAIDGQRSAQALAEELAK
ncbi:MAG: FAD-dependent monooxygenase [Muribaculaceae bacterium]|nr:FAD-dependent monooxygenase [Muribaculaceae bacterium]